MRQKISRFDREIEISRERQKEDRGDDFGVLDTWEKEGAIKKKL